MFVYATVGCRATSDVMTLPSIPRVAALATLGNRPRVIVTPVKSNDEFSFVDRLVQSVPGPSERTQLLLRKYALEKKYTESPDQVIRWLEQLVETRPTMDEIHSLSEIAEQQANWALSNGDQERANRLYASALIHAYKFLFDGNLELTRNAYDPQFRSICDIYNRSLEELLRQACKKRHLQPETAFEVGTEDQGIAFTVEIKGRWRDQVFERFELVNDYDTRGLDNHYHTYGLGVPLIGIRQQEPNHSQFEKYYPPELTLPMTAFVHLEEATNGPQFGRKQTATLTLYDPLETTIVEVGSQIVPLESDITTPLAYSLRDPLVSKGALATASLLDGSFAPEFYGMFMLEPYDPNKIPVVMVHGLWASPFTWLHMFNDLRANRDIRENYQFWFYSYPTGQPFWNSAQTFRKDLSQIQRELDPGGDSKSLDQMILVGHSMGGLLSLLQTTESNDHFWNIVSDHSISEFTDDPDSLSLLRETFYFHPNPDIDRVITIATPLQGSEFANAATRWVSHKLFTLPSMMSGSIEGILKENPDKLKKTPFVNTTTSIDSLAPDNPIFQAIAAASTDRSVEIHNIVGKLDRQSFFKTSTNSNTAGDGVVSLESANNAQATSQIFVPAEHSDVHQHPACIFEVRRVLLENLAEYDRVRVRELPTIPKVKQATLLEPIEEATSIYR